MKYIFFDIECANCYQGKGKICSFGYVITDTEFNVLDKCDLVINPAAKFNLGPDIVLAYDKNTFKHAPMFPDYYGEITTLLEEEDIMVFGFSASNDARYLNNECNRYDLPSIDYTFYDVQQIVMGINDTKNQPSLLGSCLQYGIEENQDVHKSDDDSLMTMKLLKAVCETTGKTPSELADEYKQCIGVVDGYVFKWQHPPIKPPKIKSSSPTSNKMGRETENYQKFVSFLDSVTPDIDDISNALFGKSICLTTYYEERHYRQMLVLAQLICNAGGKYVMRLRDCNCFVEKRMYKANGEIRYCSRLDTVKKINKSSQKIELISFEELLDILGIDEMDINILADNMALSENPAEEEFKDLLTIV